MKENKKIILLIATLLIVCMIGVFVYRYVENKIRKQEKKEGNNPIGAYQEEGYPSFIGTVIDSMGIFEQTEGGKVQIVVAPEENEDIRKSSDKVVVTLKEDDGNSYDPGTKVKVVHTGIIRETYPAQIDCISITEVKNKTIEMYKKALKDIIEQDKALNDDAKFIAIDFENFVGYRDSRIPGEKGALQKLSEHEKEELVNYCKQYHDTVREANFETLKQEGVYDEKKMELQGILITVEKVDSMTQDKAVLHMKKYRGGLGAIFPKYKMKLVNEFDWDIKVLEMGIS